MQHDSNVVYQEPEERQPAVALSSPSTREIIVKDTLTYSVANYISLFLGFFISIMAKRILGVTGTGYWALLLVVKTYGLNVGLGITDALCREFPQAQGMNDVKRAQKIKNAAFSYLIVSSLGGIVIVWGLSFLLTQDPVLRLGMQITALLILATHLYNVTLTMLRITKNIVSLSQMVIINTVLIAVFPLTAAYFFNVTGYAAGMVASTLVAFVVAARMGNINFTFQFDWKESKRLIRIGLAMLVSGVLFKTFMSIDKIMIAKMVNIESLGFYTIGLMAIQQVGNLPRFFSVVVFPYIQERYGARKNTDDLKNMFMRPTYLISRVTPFVIVALIFFLEWLVRAFLPQFVSGLPAMKVLMFGYFFMVVNEMSSTFVFTVNKQSRLMRFYGPLVLLNIGLNYLFIRLGWGIEGVALATSLSYFCFFVALFSYAFKHFVSWKGLAKLYGGIALVYGYFVVSFLVIDRFVVGENIILVVILKLAALGILSIPVFIRVEKKEKFFSLLFRIVSQKLARREVSHG